MIVYRICQKAYANDLSGRGAFLHGGRWNSKGKYMLYAASTRSLALLELLVHLPIELVRMNEYHVLSIELPSLKENQILALSDKNKLNGDQFLAENNLLYRRVQSVIFQEEQNIIINPLHPLADKLKIIDNQQLDIDSRFS
ncbi:RES family NAD+ phosphorylase [Jiulongibacter sp. NS-SX5]|uniref:RES family NAD+ phosphorylase n=1 Tax=Jiulongibacter sp. NS-SX5 TaxID=3463854 RepID=UPI004057F2CC